MHINCVFFFLVQKVKAVILKMRSGDFFQKLTVILQHATAGKRAGDGMFFFHFQIFLSIFWLEIQVYFDGLSVT